MLDEKFWEKYFRVYDAVNLFLPYQRLLDKICEELEIKEGEKILEAGCGTCNLVLKIKGKGGESVGLDNCGAALDICREKDPGLKVVLADLREKLPFPDNYFEKVASNNTLYAVSKEKQLDSLKELYRVLKTGGKIVLSNPKKGWSPVSLYIKGAREHFKEEGIIRSAYKMMKMIIPTIKIFYYNFLIKKEVNYHFLDTEEQKKLLLKAGFSKVSQTIFVYCNQGILNSAIKRD